MSLVYVAGKLTAPDRAAVERNIELATTLGLAVASIGCMPVIPHANTAHPMFETIQSYEFWITGTSKLLGRCDAVITCDNWTESKGARLEVELASKLGVPVFHSIDRLKRWAAREVTAS
jgi:hypothetical protein